MDSQKRGFDLTVTLSDDQLDALAERVAGKVLDAAPGLVEAPPSEDRPRGQITNSPAPAELSDFGKGPDAAAWRADVDAGEGGAEKQQLETVPAADDSTGDAGAAATSPAGTAPVDAQSAGGEVSAIAAPDSGPIMDPRSHRIVEAGEQMQGADEPALPAERTTDSAAGA